MGLQQDCDSRAISKTAMNSRSRIVVGLWTRIVTGLVNQGRGLNKKIQLPENTHTILVTRIVGPEC